MYQPKKGDIVKIYHWHGIILNVFKDEIGGQVLQVQTVRNVFQGYGPEFIELTIAPDSIKPASRDDLGEEIKCFAKMREIGLNRLLAIITPDDSIISEEKVAL